MRGPVLDTPSQPPKTLGRVLDTCYTMTVSIFSAQDKIEPSWVLNTSKGLHRDQIRPRIPSSRMGEAHCPPTTGSGPRLFLAGTRRARTQLGEYFSQPREYPTFGRIWLTSVRARPPTPTQSCTMDISLKGSFVNFPKLCCLYQILVRVAHQIFHCLFFRGTLSQEAFCSSRNPLHFV